MTQLKIPMILILGTLVICAVISIQSSLQAQNLKVDSAVTLFNSPATTITHLNGFLQKNYSYTPSVTLVCFTPQELVGLWDEYKQEHSYLVASPGWDTLRVYRNPTLDGFMEFIRRKSK